MPINLKSGQKVHGDSSGIPCEIEYLLGSGGQGEVFRAKLEDQAVALKWYHPHTATAEQRRALELIIEKGPPNEKFLWPMELATAADGAGFGYIMPLRQTRFKNLVDLMKRKIEPSFRALAIAGRELSHSFLQLHSNGLCYRDISFDNVFFDPDTGDILICDNDNVAFDGLAKGGVLGTPRFMAPEIVVGKAKPSLQTDLYSLAILLFYMFVMHHPLEGRKELSIKCMDLPAMTQLYGSEPVFIFDPIDKSNRPVQGYQDNALEFWKIYPKFFKNLFIQSFTKGIHDPVNGRVRESIWRSQMVRLQDSIAYCPKCAAENFYDDFGNHGQATTCWSCKEKMPNPLRLRIDKNTVVLNYDTKLFPHHINAEKTHDFSRPLAEVSRNPSNPKVWGLKNLSQKKWILATADGRTSEVTSGRSATLSKNAKIDFGGISGQVEI